MIVLGRFVREMANVPPFKSSTATIGEKCDMRAREVEVKLRDVNQFIMD